MAPTRVHDHRHYWTHPPPKMSPRCTWWVDRIADGWRPNKRIRKMGYDEAAEYYGVYIWEYLNVLKGLLA